LSTLITTGNDLEKHADIYAESIQSALKRSLKHKHMEEKQPEKSFPWPTESFTIMRKRVNSCRKLYRRTRNDEEQRERRKQKYVDEKVSSENREGEVLFMEGILQCGSL